MEKLKIEDFYQDSESESFVSFDKHELEQMGEIFGGAAALGGIKMALDPLSSKKFKSLKHLRTFAPRNGYKLRITSF